MTNTVTTTTEQAATGAPQGAIVAPEKAPSKKGASQKRAAPKGQNGARGKPRAAKPAEAQEATNPVKTTNPRAGRSQYHRRDGPGPLNPSIPRRAACATSANALDRVSYAHLNLSFKPRNLVYGYTKCGIAKSAAQIALRRTHRFKRKPTGSASTLEAPAHGASNHPAARATQ